MLGKEITLGINMVGSMFGGHLVSYMRYTYIFEILYFCRGKYDNCIFISSF